MKYTPQEKLKHVRQLQESGLTAVQYCRQPDTPAARTLRRWIEEVELYSNADFGGNANRTTARETLRSVEENAMREAGFSLAFLGITATLLITVAEIRHPARDYLAILLSVVLLSTALVFLKCMILKIVLGKSPHLAEASQGEGRAKFIFDSGWRQQWAAGKNSGLFRMHLVLEATALISVLACFPLLLGLLRYL